MNKAHALQQLIDDPLARKTALLDQRDQHRANGNHRLAEVAQLKATECKRSLELIVAVKQRRR